jgi:hypothetical protein
MVGGRRCSRRLDAVSGLLNSAEIQNPKIKMWRRKIFAFYGTILEHQHDSNLLNIKSRRCNVG